MKLTIQKFGMMVVILLSFLQVSAYDFELPAGNNGLQKLQYTILSSTDQTVSVDGGTTGIIPCTVTYNNKTYTVTEIGRFAFNDVNITDFRLPISLKAIRENAFGFSKATIIAIPDGVEIIESSAFWHSSIETIIVGSGVKTLGNGAFYGCSKLKTLVFKSHKAPSHNSRNYSIGNSSTTIIVPQLKNYSNSEIANVSAGSLVEPIYFPSNNYEYSGDIPQLEYVLKIGSASTPINMSLKNKDAGKYEQAFFINLSALLPSYRFSDYDGYATYPNPGVDVIYEYVINKKPLNITIDNKQRVYGDPISLEYTYSFDGFVEGEDLNELDNPIEPFTVATATSEVGEYLISCTTSARNYEIIVKDGILSILKAPLTVQVGDSERLYGDSNPTFTFEFINLRNNDNPAMLTPFKFETASISSDVGSYRIVCSEGSLKNYEITEYRSGTLTIKKAPLTLTALNAMRMYYEEDPQFHFSLTGLRNNDDASCITTKPTFECPANISSDCGEYPIIPSNADAKNYDISYSNGTLTITQATLTLNAQNAAREYGEENPVLGFDADGLKGNDTKETALQSLPTITTTASQSSNAGEYPISITGGSSKNYTLSYRSGVLTIKKAPLSVLAKDAERIYGESNPAFVRSYLGFKLSDSESTAFSVLPKIECAATKTSDVGKYPITVSDGTSQNYEITEYCSATLTIKKAPLTLTAFNAKRMYYEEDPQFYFSLTGLRNNDDASCITTKPTFECPANISSDCGEYPIIPSNADAKNYDISYSNGTLTITQATLTLNAQNAAREYGEENPVLGFDADGLKGNDTKETALQSLPTITTTASQSSNAGEYPISITGGSSKNYTLSYRSGVLTIKKAPLSVLAKDAERIYGESNPAFVRSYLGFKLSDSESTVFSVLPKIECAATKTSDVGEYPIAVSGGISQNYEIAAYENAILTVNPATATITAIDNSRLYFEENPKFDFTVSGLRNSDTKACVTTLPQYNCSASIASNVGRYEITPSGAGAQNYIFEYKKGDLIINQRNLTASVGNYSKIYGTENPNFEIAYSGFVNNEDSSILNQLVTASCEASSLSDTGIYPIVLTGGQADNYIISEYKNGELTIDKADQTITWNQDLSNVNLYSQVALEATSTANLPVTYEMSPNNVATLYNDGQVWYIDCYGSGAVNIRATQNGDKNHNAASIATKTLVVYGNGGDDPSNPQIYLNVNEPGGLSYMIAKNRKYQIKNLRLTGNLNGTDINFIREMAGSDSYGNTTPGVLETLDISGCTIVSGGRSYYQSNRTSENKVGNYMFYNCKVLTTLRIPDNTVSIGDYAFANCERLSVISIPNCVKSYGIQSFRNDISLLRLPMPRELERIDDMAFSGCNGLIEITIPSSVTYIGSGIVKDCQNIAQINVEASNTNYASRDGVLFSSGIDELIIFPVNHTESEYVVPEGVNKIASYAFVNAKGLKSINLPCTLLTIGQDAFIGCVNLNTLQVQALTPPTCQNDCFDNISKTRCQLQVPIGCRSYYWVAPVWSDFNKIVETDFSGVDNVYCPDLQIGIINGKISVSGCPDEMTVRIYQINGTLLYQGQSSNGEVQFEPTSHGVHIIMIGSKAFKLVVK